MRDLTVLECRDQGTLDEMLAASALETWDRTGCSNLLRVVAPDVERITAFEHRFAKAQATDVVDLPWGFALLQTDFPLSHNHNRIVVTSAAPAVYVLSADDVLY